MFNDISCGTKDNEEECLANARLVSLYARRFGKGQWSFIGLVSEKKWYSISEDSPQGVWDKIAEKMLLEFAESGCPIFRATSPLSRGRLKSKGHGKLSIHYAADLETVETIFRIIVSANQVSLFGAVAEICEEYESLHERTGSSFLTRAKRDQDRSSFGLWWPSEWKFFYCNKMENELQSCHNKINWINFVWMQDFWVLLRTDSISSGKTLQILHNFMQCTVVNTLFQEKKKHHNQKDGSKGTLKIGPVLEVTTSYLHGKYGAEIRILSLNRDNSHSWVRISHGSNKFVMNLNNNEQEILEVQLEVCVLKLDAKDSACRSKEKAKPQRREPAGSSPRIVQIGRRNWLDIEPGKHYLSQYEVSKKVIHLLRHSQKVHREDGAVHFWRITENLQNPFPQSIHWSDDRWKACLAAGGEAKRRFQNCTDDSGTIVFFRALQGHSGRNLIDPSLQDNVVIPSNFFQHIYHVGCAINLHSIINSGLIPGGQNLSNKQTVFFLLVDPMDKNDEDPDTIDLNEPRLAQYMHKAW